LIKDLEDHGVIKLVGSTTTPHGLPIPPGSKAASGRRGTVPGPPPSKISSVSRNSTETVALGAMLEPSSTLFSQAQATGSNSAAEQPVPDSHAITPSVSLCQADKLPSNTDQDVVLQAVPSASHCDSSLMAAHRNAVIL